MKVAFDIHGCIDLQPEFFKIKVLDFMTNGIEVYLISGSRLSQIKYEVDGFGYKKGVHYVDILSCYDRLQSLSNMKWIKDKRGDPIVIEGDWLKIKPLLCYEHDIDILVDNIPKYKDRLKNSITEFLLVENTHDLLTVLKYISNVDKSYFNNSKIL